jgi:predicted negative regulator of RcsB-dependent stress response
MAKHPTSSRVHRDDSGPDDAFVSTIKRSYSWGKENSRVVVGVLAVILVAGVAAFWYYTQQRQLETQAAARLTQVQQSVASGNAQLAVRDLQTYLDRFGSTRTADQARLVLASILLEQDRVQDALEALGSLPDDLRTPFGLPAARLQAAAHEEAGNIDEAVSTYLRISDRARFGFERREALADAARIRLQNGEPGRAADLYDQLVGMYPQDDPEHGYYQIWLAEAQAQAREGRAAPRETPDTSAATPAAEAPEGSTG